MVRLMRNRLVHEQVQPPFQYRRVAETPTESLCVQPLDVARLLDVREGRAAASA
jgi:hypothetical protein